MRWCQALGHTWYKRFRVPSPEGQRGGGPRVPCVIRAGLQDVGLPPAFHTVAGREGCSCGFHGTEPRHPPGARRPAARLALNTERSLQ